MRLRKYHTVIILLATAAVLVGLIYLAYQENKDRETNYVPIKTNLFENKIEKVTFELGKSRYDERNPRTTYSQYSRNDGARSDVYIAIRAEVLSQAPAMGIDPKVVLAQIRHESQDCQRVPSTYNCGGVKCSHVYCQYQNPREAVQSQLSTIEKIKENCNGINGCYYRCYVAGCKGDFEKGKAYQSKIEQIKAKIKIY